MSIIYGNHAIERHGDQAVKIRRQMEQSGPELEIKHPKTGRIARACPLEGRYGIQILEPDGEHEVTTFKNKSETLEQLKRYLRNAGFIISMAAILAASVCVYGGF
jgi:hypothetical protein